MKIAFVGNFDVDYSSENHHKASLESLGHEVLPFQENRLRVDALKQSLNGVDLLLWVHTHGWNNKGAGELLASLKGKMPTITYHLDLWLGLEREKDLETDPFYKEIQHFFTVDKLMADWFNENTEVKGHYIKAGVFDQECYIHPEYDGENFDYDIVFVGSKGYHHEWPYRPKLIKWLKDTYGHRFTHVGGDGEIPTTRGDDLNRLYAKSKVVIGDTLCINFDYPYYWSDRIYETTGRGGFIIHPDIKGIGLDFTDTEVQFYDYGDFNQLKGFIDFYLQADVQREQMRMNGHLRTTQEHTYKHRWEQILRRLDEDNSR